MQDTPAVWIDCDPGHDDAMALVLACHGKCDLIGVSTVSGNQSVDKTTANARKMLEICGRKDVVVLQGSERPLIKEAKHDPGIHGESGMEGSAVFDSFKTCPLSETPPHWTAAMAHRITSHPTPVSLVALGALTNVAVLARTHPEVLKNISQISFMGGAMGIGNRHPVAEFNILCDPEAAAIVCALPLPITMVPLEVTHTALVTPGVLRDLQAAMHGSRLFTMVRDLMMFFADTYKREFGFASPPLHDPCAVAWITHPHLFTTKLMRVDVVTGDHLTAGQTVCDIWGCSDRPKNVHVATAMDVAGFWRVMSDAFTRCNKVTPINAKL